jgi:hypothetical protein
MRRGAWAGDHGTRQLLDAATNGVIGARQLVRMGVPEGTVYRRCRSGGPWQLLLPAVVLLSSGTPTRDQLVTGALRYAGTDALLTGLEACRRHGVRRGPRADDTLHLLVPHDRQPRSTGYVVIERTQRLPQAVVRLGVPLAPVGRATVDAARRLTDPAQVAELMADTVQRGLCTVSELAGEVDDAQRRGTAVPRGVLRDVEDGVRSAAEADAKRLWARSGLPEPWWNAPVHDGRGRLLGVADAWFDAVALAWEINSVEWHLLPEDYAREQERTARFVAAGALVLPTQPRRLRRDPRAVIGELREAYARAGARPRPALCARRAQG